MNHSMNDVKATVQLRPEAKRAFILRIILSVLVFPTVVQYIYMFLSKALKAAGLTGVESVVSLLWKTVGSFIILLVIVLYLYRANIRKWTYSYMLNYQSQAIANGFTVCPRCSSPLNEHTGTGSYSVHVGDEVTTIQLLITATEHHPLTVSLSMKTEATSINTTSAQTAHADLKAAMTKSSLEECLRQRKMPYGLFLGSKERLLWDCLE